MVRGHDHQNSREPVQTLSRRRRTPIRRAIQVCKVRARMVPPLCGHSTGREAHTIEATKRGVHPLLKKTSCVLDKAEPPCDRKTLGICRYPRRKISAWIRNREVEIFYPQL